MEGPWPRTVFLTFQFYRFPPVTTPRLQLVSTDRGPATKLAVLAQLLVRVNEDGTLSTSKFCFWLPCVAAPILLSELGLASGPRDGLVSVNSKPLLVCTS